MRAESLWAAQIGNVDARNRASTLNLVRYWALRQQDLRDLQGRLAGVGLSSLGRSESHIQASPGAVAAAIETLAGRESTTGEEATEPVIGLAEGRRLLRRRAVALLGPVPAGRKGVNLPDSTLPVSALTDRDRADLRFAAAKDLRQIFDVVRPR